MRPVTKTSDELDAFGTFWPRSEERLVEAVIEHLPRGNKEAAIAVSVVIPVFNEVGAIGLLVEEIGWHCACSNWGAPEIIVVDDGSTDGTWEQLCRILPSEGTVFRALRLASNRGKTAALAVGLRVAAGRVVITIDGDLQDDPAEIPALLAKLGAGFDLVVGWRRSRSDSLKKRVASWLFNRGTALLSGLPLHDFNCGLKGMRSEVAKSLRLSGQQHRFIPLLADRMRFRVAEIPVNHRARKFGVSKYGVARCVPAALDLLRLVFSSKARRPVT